MTRRLALALLLLCLALGCAAAETGGLRGYVSRSDPEYRWTKDAESGTGDVKSLNLTLHSQVWRGIPWEHQVRVFLPAAPKYPRTALLFITGGNPGLADSLLFGG